jgi:hypothetical protein
LLCEEQTDFAANARAAARDDRRFSIEPEHPDLLARSQSPIRDDSKSRARTLRRDRTDTSRQPRSTIAFIIVAELFQVHISRRVV